MSLPAILRLKPSQTTLHLASACPSLRAGIAGTRRAHYSSIASSPTTSSLPRRKASPRSTFGTANAGLLYRTRTMATNGTSGPPQGLRMKDPVIFVCDMQDKFRDAIHEFDKIVLTIEKLLKFASNLSLPVHATTQNATRLGQTVPSLASLLPSAPTDKTRFSMLDASGASPGFDLPARSSVCLVGIESHICITQTALDLKAQGHRVYIMADGVSSCNRGEVVVALDRLRTEEGVTVTTSESWMYEVLGDASHPSFKGLFNVVKGSMGDTRKVLEALPPGSKI